MNVMFLGLATTPGVAAFSIHLPSFHSYRSLTRRYSEWNNDGDDLDRNTWRSEQNADQPEEDWQVILAAKKDGTYWSSMETVPSNSESTSTSTSTSTLLSEDDTAELWLNTLASLHAEEVTFNLKEADRAVKVRQMEEWGFDKTTIQNTLDVAVTPDDFETSDEVQGMQSYRDESYLDDVDLKTVESHTRVEMEDGEPIRTQMVYVDEHTCIGCTNCAMIAQSTFFMNDEHGRARVFQQWGDDDETIQVAIETCPVDCIHYVPYNELVNLEVERRGQNINPKARLVSQGEYGGASGHQVGGAVAFTPAQKISGNMGARCNNCPSRGCKNCPMYGVGKNPDFLQKEMVRKEKRAKRKLQEEREKNNKMAEL